MRRSPVRAEVAAAQLRREFAEKRNRLSGPERVVRCLRPSCLKDGRTLGRIEIEGQDRGRQSATDGWLRLFPRGTQRG
jgi:hypothetical protein